MLHDDVHNAILRYLNDADPNGVKLTRENTELHDLTRCDDCYIYRFNIVGEAEQAHVMMRFDDSFDYAIRYMIYEFDGNTTTIVFNSRDDRHNVVMY